MKTTLKKIVNAKDVFVKLSQKTLPVKESYNIAKLIRAVDAELAVYNSERMKLFKKYGELIEDGKKYRVLPENEELFYKELNELLEQEVELAVKPVCLMSDLFISAQELLAIEDFIEVTEDD